MSSLIFIRIWHKNNKKLQFTSTKSQRFKTRLLEKDLQVFIFERVNAVNIMNTVNAPVTVPVPPGTRGTPAHVVHLNILLNLFRKWEKVWGKD